MFSLDDTSGSEMSRGKLFTVRPKPKDDFTMMMFILFCFNNNFNDGGIDFTWIKEIKNNNTALLLHLCSSHCKIFKLCVVMIQCGLPVNKKDIHILLTEVISFSFHIKMCTYIIKRQKKEW